MAADDPQEPEDEDQEQVDSAWEQEIARRVAALDRGEAQLISWDELRQQTATARSSR